MKSISMLHMASKNIPFAWIFMIFFSNAVIIESFKKKKKS